MRITIASGKGGTGKTTVATNLAVLAARQGLSVQLIDCDVEEPNCHLFLKPHITWRQEATISVPEIDFVRCTGCGDCAEICQFNALACTGRDVLVFPELCHSCGGCWLVCPEHAIGVEEREIGVLEEGTADGILFSHGRLRVGEVQVPPMIELLKARPESAELTIFDAPPGTSCPAIAAMRDSDYVILVTEPTPFGLNDLELAVAAVRQLGMPFGVVVNRAGVGDERVHEWCRQEQIHLLLEIADDRRIAEAYAQGILAVEAVPDCVESFRTLLHEVTVTSGGCVT
jgi:MinD superfamily P-loop ATPase